MNFISEYCYKDKYDEPFMFDKLHNTEYKLDKVKKDEITKALLRGDIFTTGKY